MISDLYKTEQQKQKQKEWDNYFMLLCEGVAVKSHCLSRQIGAVIVRDKTVIATGYNGPPRGVFHCGRERNKKDFELFERLRQVRKHTIEFSKTCPRQLLDYKSGEGLHLCIAAHAETNCIANSARMGIKLFGTTLYLNTCMPCKECTKLIINAGIKEVVYLVPDTYDVMAELLFKETGVITRCLQ